jgi:DNA-directed RNA polymerase specialized sigma24 family protein
VRPGEQRYRPHPGQRRLLAAFDRLPEGECEASGLVRTPEMSQAEVAQVLAVSGMTAHRRVSRGRQRLAATLGDLYPRDEEPDAP